MDNTDVTFDWNGTVMRFNEWSEDAYGTYEYTTRDYRHYFVFELKKISSEVRIYITEQPSYGNRAADGHSTHRLNDSGGYYICIKEGEDTPTNVPDALSWMVYWAEETGKYIDTGQEFS